MKPTQITYKSQTDLIMAEKKRHVQKNNYSLRQKNMGFSCRNIHIWTTFLIFSTEGHGRHGNYSHPGYWDPAYSGCRRPEEGQISFVSLCR